MVTEPQILSSFSPRACPRCMLTCFSAGDPPSALYICREPSTNQLLFMQNKPNFKDAKMNVNIYYTKDYKNFIPLAGQKNKPNSNPIKPNSRKAQMNVNLTLTKDYRKIDDFSVRINKPNSNPIFLRTKTNAILFTAKDYENETAFRPKKTNPNKPNFKRGYLLIYRMSVFCLRSSVPGCSPNY